MATFGPSSAKRRRDQRLPAAKSKTLRGSPWRRPRKAAAAKENTENASAAHAIAAAEAAKAASTDYASVAAALVAAAVAAVALWRLLNPIPDT